MNRRRVLVIVTAVLLALSGMFVIDVASREEALEYAARIPAARNGAVEVRRVLDVDES